MYTISDLKIVSFPLFSNKESELIVYENGKKIPFLIPRLFVIKADESVKRGYHAHKECSQLLIVLKGECLVMCDDGVSKETRTLNDASEGLLIPPRIWSEQTYQPDTILMVMADRLYEEDDYLRDYEDFLKFRREK